MVVVGTGTEVGKTFVACAMVRGLRQAGEVVVGLKPVESGVGEDGVWRDAAALTAAGGRGPGAPLLGYDRALSPHLEARRVGRPVDLARVAAWVRAESRGCGWVVVETAGGLLSPLADVGSTTNLSMVDALEPDAVVLVARDGLGALHDVGAMRWVLTDVGLWGRTRVVLSAAPPADGSTGTNGPEVVRLGMAPSVAVVEADGAGDVAWAEWLAG